MLQNMMMGLRLRWKVLGTQDTADQTPYSRIHTTLVPCPSHSRQGQPRLVAQVQIQTLLSFHTLNTTDRAEHDAGRPSCG